MSISPNSSQAEQDSYWMGQALQLAKKSLYLSPPNPSVACLIVRDGQLLGEGSTQKTGSDHAEVQAIKDAIARGNEEALQGATFYVSLEPCSHYGRTPPCVDALIRHQAARVVIAMLDPNPLVGGRGVKKLQEAGIEVCTGVLTEEALE